MEAIHTVYDAKSDKNCINAIIFTVNRCRITFNRLLYKNGTASNTANQ